VWLWLPLCTRLEVHLLHRIDGKHDRSDRHELVLPRDPTNDLSHYRSQS
jgi:hypothetical protein